MKYLTIVSEDNINGDVCNISEDCKLYKNLFEMHRDLCSAKDELVKILLVKQKKDKTTGTLKIEIVKIYDKNFWLKYFAKKNYTTVIQILFKTKELNPDDIDNIIDRIEPGDYYWSADFFSLEKRLTSKSLENLINKVKSGLYIEHLVKNPCMTSELMDKIILRVLSDKYSFDYLIVKGIIESNNKDKVTKESLKALIFNSEFLTFNLDLLPGILSFPNVDKEILNNVLELYKNIYKEPSKRNMALLAVAKSPQANNYIFNSIINKMMFDSIGLNILEVILKNENISPEIISRLLNLIINKYAYNDSIKYETDDFRNVLIAMVKNNNTTFADNIRLLELAKDKNIYLGLSSPETLPKNYIDNVFSQVKASNDAQLIISTLIIEKNNLENLIKIQSENSELPKLNYRSEYLKILNKYLFTDSFKVRAFILEEIYEMGFRDLNELMAFENIDDYKSILELARR